MQPTADEFRRRFKAIARRFTSTAQLDVLLRKMTPTPVSTGTKVTRYLGSCSTLYFVWDGSLSVSIGTGAESIDIGALGPGEWIGEVTLIEPGPASATVTAVQDCMLLALPHETFRQLQQDDPASASALLHAISLSLAERLRTTGTQVIRRVGADSAEDKTLNPKERATIVQLVANLMGIPRTS